MVMRFQEDFRIRKAKRRISFQAGSSRFSCQKREKEEFSSTRLTFKNEDIDTVLRRYMNILLMNLNAIKQNGMKGEFSMKL